MDEQYSLDLNPMESEKTLTSSVGPSPTAGTLHLKELKVTEYIEEAWRLLEEHREELMTNEDLMILKPNVELYKALENANSLISIVAFDGDRIIGYSVSFVSPNLHFSDLLLCSNDVLFVTKEHRGNVGLKLMRMTERLAKERGCGMILWGTKPNTPLAGILPRLKYKVQDIVYSKEIK